MTTGRPSRTDEARSTSLSQSVRAPRGRIPLRAQGRVNLDELSERARDNYFYARAMVGRDLLPEVLAVH
jgi:hypothetical protein